MTAKMWALVKDKAEKGLTMKRVEIPEVGDNDVKIKIHKTAICGTDVHIYDWNEWAQQTIALGTTAGFKIMNSGFQIAIAEITLHNKFLYFTETLIFTFKRQPPGDHGISRGGTTETRTLYG